MEFTGRNDIPRNQSERATISISQDSLPSILNERSNSHLSLSRNNSEHSTVIGGHGGVSFDRTSSVGASSWRRPSQTSSNQVAPELSDDDIESEVISQAGDTGEVNSKLYSGSGTPRSSMDNFMSVEDGIVPITEDPYVQTFGAWSRGTNAFSTVSVVSPLPSEIVSSFSTEPALHPRNKNLSTSAEMSIPHVKESKKELPCLLEYISALTHLAVFGILGVFTRYLLQKLFGPEVAGITSDQTFVYIDLPSNLVGSFLMGWLGVVFKGDISRVSDLLAVGLTTGYLGSLTTFSAWNQKMLDLSVNDQWLQAIVGILLGLWMADGSIHVGIETAKGFRWLVNRSSTGSRGDASSSGSKFKFRIGSLRQHTAVLVFLMLILALLWGLSAALLRRWLDGGNTNGQLWLACIVAPPGVWARWFLARLNGRGLGRNGSFKWIPFGTLIANVSAACVMAALATVKRVVNSDKSETIATGIQFGLLGCLSTVSTFIAEFHAMRESKHPWRAYLYASITILPSFILGTFIYSVPVWTKAYQ
ncbi:hypothetical protein IFM89_011382 [Coptis chinensis]|uniref:Uncharacterized protein n=1 Tax=Coptis chinensis TaxID=261450 RepID=A0A835HKP6_9MAGN|nr:hypothetical protein IFM89_011382 [Coptis chinensis]